MISISSRHPLDQTAARPGSQTAIAAALRANPAKRHIVTSQVEHSSVLNFCMALERDGLCSGGLRPPRVDRRSTLQPGEVNLPSPESQVPRPESRYSVTYLPVDREGLLFVLV